MNLEHIIKQVYISPNTDIEIILSKSIGIFLEEIKLKNIAVTKSVEDSLIRITNDTELKWKKVSRKLLFKCSSCKSILYSSECGRFDCQVCDNMMMVPIKQLNKICETCVSYKLSCLGNLDKSYSKVIVSSNKTKKEIKV